MRVPLHKGGRRDGPAVLTSGPTASEKIGCGRFSVPVEEVVETVQPVASFNFLTCTMWKTLVDL